METSWGNNTADEQIQPVRKNTCIRGLVYSQHLLLSIHIQNISRNINLIYGSRSKSSYFEQFICLYWF